MFLNVRGQNWEQVLVRVVLIFPSDLKGFAQGVTHLVHFVVAGARVLLLVVELGDERCMLFFKHVVGRKRTHEFQLFATLFWH